jgi:hypothetical protein
MTRTSQDFTLDARPQAGIGSRDIKRERDASMTPSDRMTKSSEDELACGRRLGRHLAVTLKALCVPLLLSSLILANGRSSLIGR